MGAAPLLSGAGIGWEAGDFSYSLGHLAVHGNALTTAPKYLLAPPACFIINESSLNTLKFLQPPLEILLN